MTKNQKCFLIVGIIFLVIIVLACIPLMKNRNVNENHVSSSSSSSNNNNNNNLMSKNSLEEVVKYFITNNDNNSNSCSENFNLLLNHFFHEEQEQKKIFLNQITITNLLTTMQIYEEFSSSSSTLLSFFENVQVASELSSLHFLYNEIHTNYLMEEDKFERIQLLKRKILDISNKFKKLNFGENNNNNNLLLFLPQFCSSEMSLVVMQCLMMKFEETTTTASQYFHDCVIPIVSRSAMLLDTRIFSQQQKQEKTNSHKIDAEFFEVSLQQDSICAINSVSAVLLRFGLLLFSSDLMNNNNVLEQDFYLILGKYLETISQSSEFPVYIVQVLQKHAEEYFSNQFSFSVEDIFYDDNGDSSRFSPLYHECFLVNKVPPHHCNTIKHLILTVVSFFPLPKLSSSSNSFCKELILNSLSNNNNNNQEAVPFLLKLFQQSLLIAVEDSDLFQLYSHFSILSNNKINNNDSNNNHINSSTTRKRYYSVSPSSSRVFVETSFLPQSVKIIDCSQQRISSLPSLLLYSLKTKFFYRTLDMNNDVDDEQDNENDDVIVEGYSFDQEQQTDNAVDRGCASSQEEEEKLLLKKQLNYVVDSSVNLAENHESQIPQAKGNYLYENVQISETLLQEEIDFYQQKNCDTKTCNNCVGSHLVRTRPSSNNLECVSCFQQQQEQEALLLEKRTNLQTAYFCPGTTAKHRCYFRPEKEQEENNDDVNSMNPSSSSDSLHYFYPSDKSCIFFCSSVFQFLVFDNERFSILNSSSSSSSSSFFSFRKNSSSSKATVGKCIQGKIGTFPSTSNPRQVENCILGDPLPPFFVSSSENSTKNHNNNNNNLADFFEFSTSGNRGMNSSCGIRLKKRVSIQFKNKVSTEIANLFCNQSKEDLYFSMHFSLVGGKTRGEEDEVELFRFVQEASFVSKNYFRVVVVDNYHNNNNQYISQQLRVYFHRTIINNNNAKSELLLVALNVSFEINVSYLISLSFSNVLVNNINNNNISNSTTFIKSMKKIFLKVKPSVSPDNDYTSSTSVLIPSRKFSHELFECFNDTNDNNNHSNNFEVVFGSYSSSSTKNTNVKIHFFTFSTNENHEIIASQSFPTNTNGMKFDSSASQLLLRSVEKSSSSSSATMFQQFLSQICPFGLYSENLLVSSSSSSIGSENINNFTFSVCRRCPFLRGFFGSNFPRTSINDCICAPNFVLSDSDSSCKPGIDHVFDVTIQGCSSSSSSSYYYSCGDNGGNKQNEHSENNNNIDNKNNFIFATIFLKERSNSRTRQGKNDSEWRNLLKTVYLQLVADINVSVVCSEGVSTISSKINLDYDSFDENNENYPNNYYYAKKIIVLDYVPPSVSVVSSSSFCKISATVVMNDPKFLPSSQHNNNNNNNNNTISVSPQFSPLGTFYKDYDEAVFVVDNSSKNINRTNKFKLDIPIPLEENSNFVPHSSFVGLSKVRRIKSSLSSFPCLQPQQNSNEHFYSKMKNCFYFVVDVSPAIETSSEFSTWNLQASSEKFPKRFTSSSSSSNTIRMTFPFCWSKLCRVFVRISMLRRLNNNSSSNHECPFFNQFLLSKSSQLNLFLVNHSGLNNNATNSNLNNNNNHFFSSSSSPLTTSTSVGLTSTFFVISFIICCVVVYRTRKEWKQLLEFVWFNNKNNKEKEEEQHNGEKDNVRKEEEQQQQHDKSGSIRKNRTNLLLLSSSLQRHRASEQFEVSSSVSSSFYPQHHQHRRSLEEVSPVPLNPAVRLQQQQQQHRSRSQDKTRVSKQVTRNRRASSSSFSSSSCAVDSSAALTKRTSSSSTFSDFSSSKAPF